MKKQTELKNKKITLATLKSFIKQDTIFLKVRNSFNGMIDGLSPGTNIFEIIKTTNSNVSNTLGIIGVWCVGSSRDYFTYFNDGTFEGIEVYNSCGCFVLAKKIN